MVPKPTDQRNFTDPDCRIMKTSDGSFHYCYNVQAIADEASQVIVAVDTVQAATDVNQLDTMIGVMGAQLSEAGIPAQPRVLLADAGYCSNDNLASLADVGFDVLIATGRFAHGERVADVPRGRIPQDATLKEPMARRLRTRQGRRDYARRKAIIEPVFGQMKTRQHADKLRLRGLDGATGEILLHAIAHNLRKLSNTGLRLAAATG